MEKSNFNSLMQRYLQGKASEQERAKIDAWLDVMKTKNTTNLELSKEDEEKLFQKITNNANNVDEVAAFFPGREKKENSIRWAWQVAATLLVLVSASYVTWFFVGKSTDRQDITSQNGVEKIILNDGTLVWLQQGSKLTYFVNENEGTRNTELQGEALFEVAKDASHPFIISCGDVNLKVLGTSFSVKSMGDSLHLVVLTGKVNLSSKANDVNVDVVANEKVLLVNKEVERLQLNATEISKLTANTEYNMQFENASMEDVMERVARKFNVDIRINNNEAAKCRITADFTDRSLESTLQLITEVLNVEYSKTGESIAITGQGCN